VRLEVVGYPAPELGPDPLDGLIVRPLLDFRQLLIEREGGEFLPEVLVGDLNQGVAVGTIDLGAPGDREGGGGRDNRNTAAADWFSRVLVIP